uniref:Nodulin-like domain-containing protein n=1 Tax=Kalanchoe fedtschenkoi TaxID=63787 RepID=A0A7N0RGD9_KALFE
MVAVDSSTAGARKWQAAKGFTIQLLTGRWFMAFASLLIMSAAGATYMFSLYSSNLKSALHYDQTTLNLISFAKDLGGNVGVISGLINEVTPPYVVLLIGAVMNFSGYFVIWLAVTSRIPKPRVWQMCVYICLGANSQSFANTGALVTAVKNFPESRGVVLGLLKGFVGLSGAILTQIYHAVYGDNPSALILLIAWLPAAVSMIFLRTIRVMSAAGGGRDGGNNRDRELQVFYKMFYASLVLAGFLMAVIILQNRFQFNEMEYAFSAAVVLILLCLPLLVVIKEELILWQKRREAVNNSVREMSVVTEIPPPQEITSLPRAAETEQQEAEKAVTSCTSNVFRPPDRGEDYTILQALFSVDMLILFVATTCGVGGTLTAIDNLGQIGKSLGYPNRSITTFVSLVSIWNYLGRAVAGFASEHLLKQYKFPRPLMLTLVLFISCSGHLLIAFGVPNSLYFASVIIGFCFGAQWPLLFAIISEIFGLKYYSTLYNFGAVASPVGSYILNVVIAGKLYDREALRQLAAKGLDRAAVEELTCTGPSCYRTAFLIITAATLFGAAISFILVVRTRKFYAGDIYRRFREEARAAEMEMGVGGNEVVPIRDGEEVVEVGRSGDRAKDTSGGR